MRSDGREGSRTGQSRTGKRRFGIGKQIVFSAIIVVGLLLLAEGAVRTWALVFRTSYERYNARTGRLELVPNLRYTNSRGQEFWINSKGFVGPEFDDHPGPDVYRIIALGDSCTFATGFWKVGYPSQLQALLNDGRSSRRFEVINAGIEGYNSAFALARIRGELLRYRPHLMIIYIGWNDLMKTDPANASGVDEYPLLAELLDRSYLIKAYKKVLFLNLRPMAFRPSTADGADEANTFAGFVPAAYRSNLKEMIQVLETHGIETLLVTLPTVVQPGMTAPELQKAHVFFPYFAGAYGVAPLLSLHRVYNRTIMEVGRGAGVEVVDLHGTFEPIRDRTGHFWDTMHPNERGGALIAEILSQRIGKLEAEGRR